MSSESLTQFFLQLQDKYFKRAIQKNLSLHQFGTETPVWNPNIEPYPCRDDDIGMQGIRSAPGIDCINGCAVMQCPWCPCAGEVWDAGRGTGQLWAGLSPGHPAAGTAERSWKHNNCFSGCCSVFRADVAHWHCVDFLAADSTSIT